MALFKEFNGYVHGNQTSPTHPATSQPCLYNYTIGVALQVIITQTAPVCLICSNTASDTWLIFSPPHLGGIELPGIPSAPYILYVTSPVTTFIGDTVHEGHVYCWSSSGGADEQSFGKFTLGCFFRGP